MDAPKQTRPLYTIGHGARKASEFISLLREYDVAYLADVRSKPFSRYHPHFSRKSLEVLLATHGIRYVFMGDMLGGRPEDPACYDARGTIDYNRVKSQPFFRSGIERLKAACSIDANVAIMCSERNPADCHRSKLIGEYLDANGLLVQHIDEKGLLLEHAAVKARWGGHAPRLL